jgi:hypothetical protein
VSSGQWHNIPGHCYVDQPWHMPQCNTDIIKTGLFSSSEGRKAVHYQHASPAATAVCVCVCGGGGLPAHAAAVSCLPQPKLLTCSGSSKQYMRTCSAQHTPGRKLIITLLCSQRRTQTTSSYLQYFIIVIITVLCAAVQVCARPAVGGALLPSGLQAPACSRAR